MTWDLEKKLLRAAVEKDLGIPVDKKLDMSQPKKSTLSCMQRTMANRSRERILPLC